MSSPREKLQGADACPVMNSSMSACTSEKKSPSGSRTPERPPSDNSPISDDTCPICLSHITDKCVANSCLHGFCLVCLKEWSKQKAVCPLCKLSFTTIMYDIKSESEYKEWKVPRPEPLERSQGIANFQEFLDAERRRFFGYRTTNFPGAATLRRQHPGRTHAIPDAIPSGPRERRHSRYYLRGSSMFRLSVYLNNVWVQPIADITGRYRQSSPDLYREQPALTHRLVPWVNRELAALLPSSRIGVVLGEVMDLIERYAINSREFRRAMQEHLGRRTNHFVHEFYHFARSPYDMVGHDNAAQYVPRYGFNNEDSSTSSSDDSDAVVEVDMSGNPVIVSAGEARQGTTTPGAVEREETLTHEGSVVISSDNFSSSESNEPTSLMSGLAQTQPDFSETHNPEPPESLYMNRLIGRARDFLSTINEGASTSRPAGSSGMQSAANSTLKTEVSSDSEQSDACIVIEEVKKRHKTPEIINLDSDEGEQHAPPLKENDNHWKKKLSKDFIKDKNSSVSSVSSRQHKVKEKQKPTLKRTNFPLHISQSSCSSTSNRKSAKEDHSYCNEHDSASIEASSSNDHNGSIQTSSIEISLKWHKSSKNHDSTFSVKKKDKQCASLTDASSSNDDSSLPNLYCKKRKQKDKGKKASNKRNLTAKSRSTGNTVGSLSSRNRMKSPSRELNASPKRMKKDHRSKIKSSSRFSSCHDAHARNSFTPSNSSESSEESWCPSDRLWTPPSNKTEGSSSQDQCWDSHSKQSSGDSKDSCFREWKDEHSSSKSKHSNKKRKRKSKDRRKSEKSKKSKKSKHKKKGKSKKSVYKCSSSDSETDFSEQSSKRQKKRKRRLADSSSRSESESIEIGSRKRARKTMILSDTSSTSHVSPGSVHSSHDDS